MKILFGKSVKLRTTSSTFSFYFTPADEVKQKILRFCWNCQTAEMHFFFLKNNQLKHNVSKDFSTEIKKRLGEWGKGRFQRKGNAEAKIGANEDSMLWSSGGGG